MIACHSVTLPSTRNWGHEGPGVAVATLPALSIFRDDDRAGDFPRPMTPTRGNQRPRSMTLTRGNRRPWPPVVCGGTTMPVPPWAVFRGAGARTLAALFVVPAVGAASTHTMLHGRLFCHQEATGFAVIAMPRNPRVHVRSCRWSSGVWSGGCSVGVVGGGWQAGGVVGSTSTGPRKADGVGVVGRSQSVLFCLSCPLASRLVCSLFLAPPHSSHPQSPSFSVHLTIALLPRLPFIWPL